MEINVTHQMFIEWIHWNEILPMTDNVLIAYKQLYNEKDINDEQENLLNWFITTVLPIVHVASQTKLNWRPFAFQHGIPPLYSTFVTTSNEAFALFLLKHYRNPPPPKEEKLKKGKAQTDKSDKKGTQRQRKTSGRKPER